MEPRATHWPDGLEDRHAAPSAGRHALPVGLVVLSLVMAAGLLGLAGREETTSASDGGVRLEWHAPTVIRNGEFLEMRITLDATEEITRPVLGVDASIWEDLTVNTFIPAAVDESSEDGEFRFEFATLEAGSRLLVKVDAQINPDILGGNAGVVTVYDGGEALVSLPVTIEVLP
jgi:hypothetical protein